MHEKVTVGFSHLQLRALADRKECVYVLVPHFIDLLSVQSCLIRLSILGAKQCLELD